MKKKKSVRKKDSRIIKPGGISEYIAAMPKVAHAHLKTLRTVLREVAPEAVETLSYFDMPGYSIEGYAYNGMFAWFSYKDSFVRLHVRPQAILKHKAELEKYTATKAIVSFALDKSLPRALVKKLVQSSLQDMLVCQP